MTSLLARKLAKRAKDRALGYSDSSGIHIALPAGLLQSLVAAVKGVPQEKWPEVLRQFMEEGGKLPPFASRLKCTKRRPACYAARTVTARFRD